MSEIVHKFINNKDQVVPDCIDGLCLTNKNLKRIKNTQIVVNDHAIKQNKVQLICGGGSGHEPAHAGFVCDEILAAAVCGNVFASPSTEEIVKAIEYVYNDKGVLVIIKNYTGDVLNFRLAVSIAKVKGMKVESIIVDDDISLDIENKRGIAGTVLLYKILGAQAAAGKSLEEITQFANVLLKQLYTIGVSLSQCALPGAGYNYKMQSDEMEIGLGIHGEKGKERCKIQTVDGIMVKLMHEIEKKVKAQEEAILFLNNLGSTTDLEMMIFAKSLMQSLTHTKIHVLRVVIGKYMTSLETHGVSITLLTVKHDQKNHVLEYVDLPVKIPWTTLTPEQNYEKIMVEPKIKVEEEFSKVLTLSEQGNKFKEALRHLFEELIALEKPLNEMDAEIGDGDIGQGVALSGKAVLPFLEKLPFDTDLPKSFQKIGEVIAKSFGGSSGPLYGSFFIQGSKKIEKKLTDNTFKNFFNAFKEGSNAIQYLGRAKKGDRTMVDCLVSIESSGDQDIGKATDSHAFLDICIKGAETGAEIAKGLKARKGRSMYQDGKEIGFKEPGCELIVIWMKFIKKYFM